MTDMALIPPVPEVWLVLGILFAGIFIAYAVGMLASLKIREIEQRPRQEPPGPSKQIKRGKL